MGTRVNVPSSARVSVNEQPYWMLQCIPDRIRYTLKDTALGITTFMPMLTGGQGYNSRLETYLETLGKMEAIDPTGKLMEAFLAYSSAVDDAQDPRTTQAVQVTLTAFQNAAHKASSYIKLPVKAHRAVFFNGSPNVSLPRITMKEHMDMS